MFDERSVVVGELRPLAIHGMPYVDVVLTLDDGGSLSARLGPEAVPEGLAVGDRVIAVTVMANVLELRRSEG
jgi:TOBE domain